MQGTYVYGLRALALVGLATAIYIVLGSWKFPSWWFGLFWGSEPKFGYVKSGLTQLTDNYFRLSITIVLLLSLAVFSVIAWGARVFPLVDRFASVTIFCVAVAVLLDALVVRHFQRTPYSRGTAAVAQLRAAATELAEALSAGPNIEPPIYFHYMDEARIDALYSQIPKLQLTERTVSTSNTLKGKAELNLGASVSVEKGRDGQSTDKLEAGELSADRKCVEVMKYVLETCPNNCYGDALDWCLRELGNELSEPLKSMVRLQPVILEKPTEDAKTKIQRWQKRLENGLRQVDGMVFVYGEFEPSPMEAGPMLFRKFSTEPPFKCLFRVRFPQAALDSLPAGKLRKLTVFGTAVRPLGDDGFVDVAAVAVF